MNNVNFVLHETAGTPDEKAIYENLRAYNAAQAGASNAQPLILACKDAQGTLVAGVCAKLNWSWLYIDLFWVHDSWRGKGLGAKLLNRIEDEARRRGCKAAHLFTYSFQAPGFYERHGYSKFAELSDYPPGHTRLYFKKPLRDL